NTPWHVRMIFDYIESMVRADRYVAPPSELSEYVFNYYDWDVRPKDQPQPSSTADVTRVRIVLLSHADTDLLALRRAQPLLPGEVDVVGLSLMRIQTEEQMSLLLDGDMAGARVIVLRLHGDIESVAGIGLLQERARQWAAHFVVVSGTGEPRADFARASTVGPVNIDVLDAVRLYLMIGGEQTLAECVKFLSDCLLLTGYGSVPPIELPEHGVYLREVENATLDDWHQRADPLKPTAAVLFYRAHLVSGNLGFV